MESASCPSTVLVTHVSEHFHASVAVADYWFLCRWTACVSFLSHSDHRRMFELLGYFRGEESTLRSIKSPVQGDSACVWQRWPLGADSVAPCQVSSSPAISTLSVQCAKWRGHRACASWALTPCWAVRGRESGEVGKDAQKVRQGDEPSGDRGQQCGAELTTQHISRGDIAHDWKARPRQKGQGRFWGAVPLPMKGILVQTEKWECHPRASRMMPGHWGPLQVCRLDSGVRPGDGEEALKCF